MLDIWVACVSYEVEKKTSTRKECQMHIAKAQAAIGKAKFHFEMMLLMSATGRDDKAEENYKKGIDILANAYEAIEKDFRKELEEVGYATIYKAEA